MNNEVDLNDKRKTETTEKSERYLQFDLGSEGYATKLLDVKEVIPMPETTPIPNSQNFYVGIMNLRGKIISVIDLRKKLNIKPGADLEEAVVIVEIGDLGIGLVVDSINRVINLKNSEISNIPELQSQVNSEFIKGVYRGKDKLTIILDLEKVLK